MNADEKLRDILRVEADRVDPSPAGWDRIKETVAVRRRRRTWLRGSLAAATAMSLVAAVALVAAPDRDDRVDDEVEFATQTPTPPPSDEPGVFSPIAIGLWPLTTDAEIAAWQADPSAYPYLTDLDATATKFATEVLGIDSPIIRSPEGDDVLCCTRHVSRRVENTSQELSVTTLTMHDPTQGEPGYVVSAEASTIEVTSPAPDGCCVVVSPLVVSGTFAGVDQVIDVMLRAAASAGGGVIARSRADVGPDGWRATLTFTTTARTGSVVVSTYSNADGGLAEAFAMPVAFGESATQPSPAPTATAPMSGAYPVQFVGVQDSRIALFDTKTGSRLRYLTEQLPGGGASDPFVTDDGQTLVYVQGEGTCAASIREVAISGGPSKVLVRSADGRVPSSPTVSAKGELAYISTTCAEGAPGDSELVAGTKHIPVQTEDHGTIRDIAWSPDGDRVAVLTTVCCAQSDRVHVVDPAEHALVSDGQDLGGPNTPCQWNGLAYALDSRLLTAEGCVPYDDGGTRTTRVRDVTDARRAVVEGAAGDWIETVSIDRTGDHLILGALTCDETCDHAPSAAYRFSVDGEPRLVARGVSQPVWIY